MVAALATEDVFSNIKLDERSSGTKKGAVLWCTRSFSTFNKIRSLVIDGDQLHIKDKSSIRPNVCARTS